LKFLYCLYHKDLRYVKKILGKAEVGSSILPYGTMGAQANKGLGSRPHPFPPEQ
jgi:hypothetical protein